MPDYTAHVVLGESLTPVGQLRFTATGLRQFSTFVYEAAWIHNPRAFAVQPVNRRGRLTPISRRSASKNDPLSLRL
jgi:hypothetical protein